MTYIYVFFVIYGCLEGSKYNSGKLDIQYSLQN